MKKSTGSLGSRGKRENKKESRGPNVGGSYVTFGPRLFVSKRGYSYLLLMLPHSAAQLWHSAAHFVQWSSLNIPHSCAHSLQIVSHNLHKSIACFASFDINYAASLQIHAHSLKVAMQFFLLFTSGSLRHRVIHSIQACAHL